MAANRTYGLWTGAIELLADEGITSKLAFSIEGSDGNPSAPCAKFLSSVAITPAETERAKPAAGTSWATIFTIPTTSRVLSIENISYMWRFFWTLPAAATPGTSIYKSRFLADDGTNVAADLTSDTQNWDPLTGDNNWLVGLGMTGPQVVSSAYRLASTLVRLEMADTVLLPSLPPLDFDHRFDALVYQVTYSLGGSEEVRGANAMFTPHASSNIVGALDRPW